MDDGFVREAILVRDFVCGRELVRASERESERVSKREREGSNEPEEVSR